jgi:hypothetical protein
VGVRGGELLGPLLGGGVPSAGEPVADARGAVGVDGWVWVAGVGTGLILVVLVKDVAKFATTSCGW